MATRKVPRKNIAGRLHDVRSPYTKEERAAYESAEHTFPPDEVLSHIFEEGVEEQPRITHASGTRAKVFFAIAGVVILIGGFFIRAYQERAGLVRASQVELGKYRTALGDLKLFPEDAGEPFPVPRDTSAFGGDFFGMLRALVTDTRDTYQNLARISESTFAIVQELSRLGQDWPDLVFAEQGTELVQRMESIHGSVATLSEAGDALVASESARDSVQLFDPGEYLAAQLNLRKAKNFLDVLLPWLRSPDVHHLAVLLENPSEMRPGGGFVGSYADVAVRGGRVEAIDVYDINDADREFAQNIVPPKPLQALVTRWRAADANWFFDFSDSARKTLEFLGASKLYLDRGIVFDGVLGISGRAIGDLLAATGPIELPAYRLTLTRDNFLTEIQRIVQAGQEKGAVAPKKILQDFTDLLIARLRGLDALLYFKDPDFQKFFDAYGLTGKVADLPQDFSGDYFALVNANIGGGKTDLVMRQEVVLQSQILASGEVSNHLVIRRAHRASSTAASWYRATNENYGMVFVPPMAELTYAKGGVVKKITPLSDYTKKGFVADPDVVAIESTLKERLEYPEVVSFRESGKNVFAVWSSTKRGATSELTLDYTRTLLTPPGDGKAYEFIFEKQAGSAGSYRFELHAPVGYEWKENGLPTFTYESDDPPGRLILNLTLTKI